MPFFTVHDFALIVTRLTGFLVIVSMVLMAPASVWIRMGATRINELITLFNRLSLSDSVDLIPHHESYERVKWPFLLSLCKRLTMFA